MVHVNRQFVLGPKKKFLTLLYEDTGFHTYTCINFIKERYLMVSGMTEEHCGALGRPKIC